MTSKRASRLRHAAIAIASIAIALLARAIDPGREISQYGNESWTVEKGLPHGTVRSILETSDGYVWMATYEGLARFNGYEFAVFDGANTPAIANSSATALLEGSDRTLWIGTNGGLVRYRDREFTAFTKADGLSNDSIYALAEGPDRSIWIGTNGGGLNRFRDGRFEQVGAAEGLARQAVTSLVFDGDGALWIGTNGGVARMKDGGFRLFTTRDGLYDNAVLTLLRDRDGAIWVGTYDGLNRIREGRVERLGETLGVPPGQITSLFQDEAGSVWAGTYGAGLLRVRGGHIGQFGRKQGLLNESVRSIYEDSEGNLWVGTNGGVQRLTAAKFVNWSSLEGLVSDYARTLLESRDGRVWIGTAGGLSVLEGGKARNYDEKSGLVASYVLSLCESRDGAIWIGTTNGLNRMAGGRVTHTYTTRDGLSNPSIRAIVEDSRGTVWIGTDRGLNALRAGKIESFSNRNGLQNDIILNMAIAKDDTLWIATDGGGLVRFRDGAFATVAADEGLGNESVLSVRVDDDGTVWAGTDSKGLVRYRDGRITRYTASRGLYRDKVTQILDDGAGNLWFGSSRGIFVLSRAQLDAFADGKVARLTPTVYGQNDGLRSIQCNGASGTPALRGRDGRLWFATTAGVASIDPKSLPRTRSFSRPIVIESVVADGHAVPVVAKGVELPPGTGRFELRYAALTFSAPEKVVFRHRLEGWDDEWLDVGDRRLTSYNNIPPGKYRFRVIAAGSDGVWTAEGASLPVTILPFFYQTLAFKVIVALGVVALALSLHRYRLARIEAQRRRLELLVDDRTRELAEANRKLEHLSTTDGLTGIANRRRFDARLQAEWNRAMRAGSPISLLLADVDHFKKLNDSVGHQAGDDCLRRVATAIDAEFRRAEDLVARYGGEEMAVILTGLLPEDVAQQAERARRAIEALALPHPLGVVTVSIGAATMRPREGSSPDELIAAADAALYRAKSNGRNRVESGVGPVPLSSS
jgi:diguanylate cyclase (GGDEF)-like protein